MPTYLKKILSVLIALAIATITSLVGAFFSQNLGNSLFFIVFTLGILITWEGYDQELLWQHVEKKQPKKKR